MARPHVVVIGGPNGAGKSTIAPYFLRDYLGIPDFVNADQIASGLSAYAPESAAFEAGRIMLQRIRSLAASGQSFAFESTLSSRTFCNLLLKLKRDGYLVDLCYVWLNSAELAQQRVAARVRLGGHSIPHDVIARRYPRSVRNFRFLYLPLADNWRVFDNSDPATPTLVASGNMVNGVNIFEESAWNAMSLI
jgi:predicted ABC-type ATPase